MQLFLGLTVCFQRGDAVFISVFVHEVLWERPAQIICDAIMLVGEETRREWGIPLQALVLPVCFLDYAGLRRVRSPQPLTPSERRHLKLVAHCPKGGEVYGGKEDCGRCRWWIKTMFCVIICGYPRVKSYPWWRRR